jgi:CRP-like cAMP-binding protein
MPIVLGQEEPFEEGEEEDMELELIIPEEAGTPPPAAKVPIVVGTLIQEPPSPPAKPLGAPAKEKSQAPEAFEKHPSPSWAESMKPPSIRPAISSASLGSSPVLPESSPRKKSEPSQAAPVFDLEDSELPKTEERLSAAQAKAGAEQLLTFHLETPEGSALPKRKKAPVAAQAKATGQFRPSSSGAFYAIEDAAKASLEEQGENPNDWLLVAKHSMPSAGLSIDIPLFSDLPQPALMALFNYFPLRRFSPETFIISQGERGNSFFIVCSGKVRVFRVQDGEEVELALLKEGEFFGEMALLSGEPRSAFVEAVEPDTQVLEIPADALAGLSRKFPQVSTALWRFYRQRLLSNVMAGSLLFKPFALEDRQQLIRCFQSLDVSPLTAVVSQNQMSEGLFVVLVGRLEVIKDGQKIAELKEGELFGEISLLTKAPATASVVAAERSSLLKLPANDFNGLICTHPQVLELLSRLMEERMNTEEEFSLASLGWDSEDFEGLI